VTRLLTVSSTCSSWRRRRDQASYCEEYLLFVEKASGGAATSTPASTCSLWRRRDGQDYVESEHRNDQVYCEYLLLVEKA